MADWRFRQVGGRGCEVAPRKAAVIGITSEFEPLQLLKSQKHIFPIILLLLVQH
jgi:hypothetical protein